MPTPRGRRGRTEAGEADAVVGPFGSVGAKVGVAGSGVEMWGVDHQQVERPDGGSEHLGGGAPNRSGNSYTVVASVRPARIAGITGHDSGGLGAGGTERRGRAPMTSPRPPVFTSGKISEPTARTRIKSDVQPVDHGLGNETDSAFGATEAAGVVIGVLADHEAGRDF